MRIVRGHRLVSQKSGDTVSVKIAGGPVLPVLLDVVKNEDALFSLSELDYYEFRMKNPVSIDGRRQFVVSFRPRMKVGYALNFWKNYNIIEPTESLEKAVLKLKNWKK